MNQVNQPDEAPPELVDAEAAPVGRLLLGLLGILVSALYVLTVGGILFWLGLAGWLPRRSAPRSLDRSAMRWLLPTLGLAAIELESYLGRSAFQLAWLCVFWRLVRR